MACHGALAAHRRLGLRDALRRAGELAMDRGCVAVTLGGDIYEHDRAGADTAGFLVDTFASWSPVRVLLAPGNHDALLPGSIYSRTRWPANVHLFRGDRLAPVILGEGLTVWGLAHHELVWQGNPLEGAQVGRDGGTHLALFHGAEMGSRPEGKSMHGPFRAEEIRERGFTAALCGHYHRRRLDLASGLVYPGSPEPLTFDETEPRGPVVVEVAGDGTVTLEALDINRWHARSVSCDVSEARGVSALLDSVLASATLACAGAQGPTTMLRLDLCGSLLPGVAVDGATIETYVRETCGIGAVRVRDLTTTAGTAALGEGTVAAAFARSVGDALGRADATEQAVLKDALRYGLQALSGAEVGLR